MGHDLQAHDLHDLAAGTSAFYEYDVAGAPLQLGVQRAIPIASLRCRLVTPRASRLTRLLLAATCCLASATLLPRILEVSVPG